MQGLLGAALALAFLGAGYQILAPRLAPLANVALDLPRLSYLAPGRAMTLVLAGGLLGALGGLIARTRSHRR
jgi:cell division protein FtsX